MTNLFVWASPHKPSDLQLDTLDGKVVFLADIDADLQSQLSNIKQDTDLDALAKRLIRVTANTILVQPAGSPAFQLVLGKWLARTPLFKKPTLLYAFSDRVSTDIPQPDGSIKKVSTFVHKGWVSV